MKMLNNTIVATTLLLLFVGGMSNNLIRTAEGANVTQKTLCTLPILADIQMAAHAGFATTYYASKFPQISWSHKYLTSNSLTAKNFVKTWVLEGITGCDFLVGPGYSFLATAISPLVDVPWVDPSATSTELSDKTNHKSFSRVIPTDEVGAKAAAIVYSKFGWNSTNIFCSDESYGRSVANGLSSAIQQQGGKVEVHSCLEASADGDRVTAVLEKFLASKTKVVFVAMLPFHPVFVAFREQAKKLNASDSLVFFYSEAMCSASDRTYTDLPGGICATYLADPATIDPFLLAYRARNVTAERSELQTLGYPPTADINTSSNIYAVLAHDAALHAMSSIHAHHVAQSSTDIFEFLRAHVSVGATGSIKLESNGDRGVVDGVVYNSQPGGKEKVIATIKNQIFEYTDEETVPVTVRPDMYYLRQLITPADEIPAIEAEDDSSNVRYVRDNTTSLIIVIVVGIFLLTVVAFLIPVIGFLKGEQRDVANAPTNQEEPFAIVFTDIQSSTTLWARAPVRMSEAVDAHHQLIRKLLRQHKGYEVKTIGDSFMCAFRKADHALEFSNDLQLTFLNYDWGDGGEIEGMYQELLDEMGVTQSFDGNGLRVRLAVNYGSGNIMIDEVTKAYDYYGTVVNTAARVEAVGHGGQSLITDAALAALDTSVRSTLHIVDLGPQALRGLDDGIRLHQVCPSNHEGLVQRKFPSLRLEKALDVDVGDETTSNTSGRSAVSMASKVSHIILDNLAMKHAKRHGYAGDPAMVDRLLDLQQYTRILLSTSDKSYREKTMQHLCSKWRVTIGEGTTHQGDIKNDVAYQSTILDIASKVMGVSDAQNARGTRRNNSGLQQGANGPVFATWRRQSRRESKLFGGFQAGAPMHDDLEGREITGPLGFGLSPNLGPSPPNPNPLMLWGSTTMGSSTSIPSIPEHADGSSSTSPTPRGGGKIVKEPTAVDVDIRIASCGTTPEPQ